MGKNFALIGDVHTSWQIETAAGFRLTRYSWVFFYIQKSKFQSVSCSVLSYLLFPIGMQLLQSLCVSSLSKRVLKLEPRTWCPVSVWIPRPCPLSRALGTLTYVACLQIPVWFLNVKSFLLFFYFVLFLFLEAVCSILRNKSNFDYAIGWFGINLELE